MRKPEVGILVQEPVLKNLSPVGLVRSGEHLTESLPFVLAVQRATFRMLHGGGYLPLRYLLQIVPNSRGLNAESSLCQIQVLQRSREELLDIPLKSKILNSIRQYEEEAERCTYPTPEASGCLILLIHQVGDYETTQE
jgi:hypothetical protein